MSKVEVDINIILRHKMDKRIINIVIHKDDRVIYNWGREDDYINFEEDPKIEAGFTLKSIIKQLEMDIDG
jgi:hypothetical protein